MSDAAGQPALQARYVWGEGLAPLAMWRKLPDGSVKLFFHLSDGQDSVRQLTDASGAVVDSYFYDAWGNTLDGSSNHVANPFRYTGQQLDADGRYYLRARFYNPGTGRFLSHDPLMGSDDDPHTLHRYLYAGGDGVNFRDPSGKFELADIMATILDDEVLEGVRVTSTRMAFEYVGKQLLKNAEEGVADAIFSASLDIVAQLASEVIKSMGRGGFNEPTHASIDWLEVVDSGLSSFVGDNWFGTKRLNRAAFGAVINALTPWAVWIGDKTLGKDYAMPTLSGTVINAVLGAVGTYVSGGFDKNADEIAQRAGYIRRVLQENPEVQEKVMRWAGYFIDQAIENIGTSIASGSYDALTGWGDRENGPNGPFLR